MNITGPKILFTIPVLGGITITQTTLTSFVATLILCVAGVLLGRNLKKRPGRMQVLVEKGVSMFYNLVGDAMGQHNRHWTPFVGALFLSSLLGTLLGMTGFLRSSTSDLSTTATWAVLISLICWYQNIKNIGVKAWLKGFTQPIFVMTPMNIISEFAQPVSLAFRHFGNIAGGSVITALIYWALAGLSSLVIGMICSNGYVVTGVLAVLGVILLIIYQKKRKGVGRIAGIVLLALSAVSILQLLGIFTDVPIFQIGIPAVLSLYFDVFSGVIQAFVFALLSMIYISNACPPPEECLPRKSRKAKTNS